jgi:hypothetical protein
MGTLFARVKTYWKAIRGNRYVTAAEGAFFGTLVNSVEDAYTNNHLDFSKRGWEKLLIHGACSAFLAVRMLYRKPTDPDLVPPLKPSAPQP